MKKKKILNLILPNKKINLFVGMILTLGILSGSIFLMILNTSDKNAIMKQIQNFCLNISNGTINSGQVFKNSLIINYLFVGLIWIFGLSLIGILLNIFITYIKGFLVGFSISSIFLTYKFKGIIFAFIYASFGIIINIIVVSVCTIYSISFSYNIIKNISSNKRNDNNFLKKYFVILMFAIIFSFISSLLEAYLLPRVLKIIIKLYV